MNVCVFIQIRKTQSDARGSTCGAAIGCLLAAADDYDDDDDADDDSVDDDHASTVLALIFA